ncbi:ABC transporter ATP-binding protein [Chromatiales bacterium (ex Bugula neritina AB1)]|nr:ABC transporter ATP-binding protein [Chromatiales bacterium (ex Bugula neritina AB1)]
MILQLESLTVSHQRQKLIGPISFGVLAGEPLVIMGETGAGKSLIAQAVMGTLPNTLTTTGKIYLNRDRIDNLPINERQRLWGHSLTILPQEPWHALDPLMPAISQVAESHRFVAGNNGERARKNAQADFKKHSLLGAEQKRPGQLSGGMGQRVAFAAAVAGGAPLLLADEPTKGLDSDRASEIIHSLLEVANKGGLLVVITHDVRVASNIGGQLLVLKEGRVIESSTTHKILASPQRTYTQTLIQAEPKHWDKTQTTANATTLLETKQLIVGREGKAMSPAIDLQLRKGQRIAITGPSGVGKSTFLDTIASLVKPIAGNIALSPQIGPTDIQKLYQDPPASFPSSISLKQSLDDVSKLHQISWPNIRLLLTKLKIDMDILQRKPDAVSGGELQRIAIARALSVKPMLVLADEPTSRLDPITQKETMNLLADVARKNNTAVLLVTHDKAMAQKWAESTLALSMVDT